MTVHPRRLAAAVVAVSAALVACGGGAGEPAAGPTSGTAATGATTTLAPTTLVPPATVPPATVAPTTAVAVPTVTPGGDDELPVGDAAESPPAALAAPQPRSPEAATEPAGRPLAGGGLVAPASPDLRLRYVVVPHPDDEFEAWSLIGGDRTHYTVFILMTRGENTAHCDGHGTQANLGERMPSPVGFRGPGGDCALQRLDAWDAFLDAMASVDAALDLPVRAGSYLGAAPPAGKEVPSRPSGSGGRVAALGYELWVGPRTARVAFDFGDRDLTPSEVLWAVSVVRSLRGGALAGLAEDDAVAAAYFNDRYDGGLAYDHPDHRAVHEALFHHDLGLPGPQWGRTVPGDPDRADTFLVDPGVYCAAMCVGAGRGAIDPAAAPDALRVGFLQWAYGWLADPYWAGAELPSGSVFSRSQDFWRRF